MEEHGSYYLGFGVLLKQIEYGVYRDLVYNVPKAIFYLLQGDYIPKRKT